MSHGFMHGGEYIRSKYIEPSNRLAQHQISTHQYDFKALGMGSPMAVYADMMKQVNAINLNEDEYTRDPSKC